MYFNYIILLFVSHNMKLLGTHPPAIRFFRIISIPSTKLYFPPPDHVISMECSALNFRCQCTQQKLQSMCVVLTFDPQHRKILAFSVKDRYQLNYFICIKDFNAETITSLKINLFSCLNHTVSKQKTCLSQTDLPVPSTKRLSNLNLCKPNTCLN
jgi:hypothetical protein